MNQLQAIRNALLTAKRDGGKAVPVSYHERKANLKKFNPITGGDGEPKVFYHGTSKDKDFKSFNVGRHGAWFTSDPDSASSYADNNDSQGHSYERGEFVPKNNASRVMPVHLNVENPYRGEMPDSFRNSENYKSVQSNWFDSLRAAGHDSWVPDVHKGELVVVLKRPAQVKSAIGNQGTFDSSSPDTNKADGGRVRKADGGTLTYIDPVTGLPRQGVDTPKNPFALEPAESAEPNFAPPSQISNVYPGGNFEPDDFSPGQTQPGGGVGPAAASQPDFNKSLPGTESTNYGRIGGLAGSLLGPGGYAAGRAAGTAADVNAVNRSIKGYGFGEELTPGQIASGVGNSMSFGLFGTPMGEAATQNINAGVNAFEQDPANAAFMANSIADDLAGPGGPQSGMATSAGSTGFGGQEQDVDAAANEAASSETESASESESESGGGGDGGDGGGSEGGGDERRGGRVYHKASGGSTMPIHDHAQAIRAALLTARGMADGGEVSDTETKARVLVRGEGPGGVKGIVIPRHLLEGGRNSVGGHIEGLNEIKAARAEVYGSENRDPLNVKEFSKIHRDTLEDHFKKPINQQKKDENEAIKKLRKAKIFANNANTLDESEKLDTARHEYDDKGRSFVGFGSKGIAGHALYYSGHGENEKTHILNTCAGQTKGCSGGIDANGIVDTSRGTCFAPNAESQYPGAAIRRSNHEQAKHDPAMTKDWIIAHTGGLRNKANTADSNNQRLLFRPNIVDETDRSTRYVIQHLNDQRAADKKPPIISNSYSKTDELHDPKNGIYVTHSNIGPKVKPQSSGDNEPSENEEVIGRDKQRIMRTITARDAAGRDFKNEKGDITPPKNSYMVTDVKRYSDLDKRMQDAFTHAKYWSTGKPQEKLSKQEKEQGPEAHYDGEGNSTSPDKSHFGHTTLNGMRYDYQRQHILHPRMVQVGSKSDPKIIPTDSRFMDDDFLPKDRFMSPNGKQAGAILLTTPTTSTSAIGHQSAFTHHVDDSHIDHAIKNNGEYEIDPPKQQQAAAGTEYKSPRGKEYFARGGAVEPGEEYDFAFPEQHFHAQRHIMHRHDHEKFENGLARGGYIRPSLSSSTLDRALRLTSPERLAATRVR